MRTDPLFNNYSLIREIPSGMRDSFLRETESLTRLTKLSIRPFNYTDYFDMRRKFFYKRSEHW